MNQNNIILYSKYSNSSTKLIKMINTYPVDLLSTLGVSLVCVDNEIIRKQILNCSKIKVKSVPSLLIVHSTGDIDLYENESIFEWFNEQININPSLKPPEPPPPIPQPILPPQEPEVDKQVDKQNTLSEKNKEQKTNINNINLDEKFDESVSRPPVVIRNNEGGYDLSDAFGEPDSPNRDMKKHIRSSTQQTKDPDDVMSQALAMQKDREKTEPKNPITSSITS